MKVMLKLNYLKKLNSLLQVRKKEVLKILRPLLKLYVKLSQKILGLFSYLMA
jgi:hypothetical protein